MSTNSVLESWMDDNSITEKTLRRGLKLHEEREQPFRLISGVPFPVVVMLIVMAFGIGMTTGTALFTSSEKEEAIELSDVDNAKLPPRFIQRELGHLKVGEIGFVGRGDLIISEKNRSMWINITNECSDRHTSWDYIQLERTEKGFAATFFEEDINENFNFDPVSSRYIRLDTKKLLPIVSLEIRKMVDQMYFD